MFVEGIYVSMPHAAKLSGVSTLLHSPKLLFTFEGVHILTLLFWCVTLGKLIYLCEPLFAHLYNGANNRSALNVIMCRKPFTSIELVSFQEIVLSFLTASRVGRGTSCSVPWRTEQRLPWVLTEGLLHP